jgi:hypothetical protein
MPGFWRKCRIGFRWFRLAVWLAVLAVLCAFIWFNRVGLPGFLKTRLVAALHERGVDLEFSRLQLSLVRGLVAGNVRVRQAGPASGPELAAREVQLRLDFASLLHRQLQVDGLVLRDGVLTCPVTPDFTLTATNLEFDLRFGIADSWMLDNCTATMAGIRVSLGAEIAHAPELLQWDWFRGSAAGASPAFQARLEGVVAALQKIRLLRSLDVSLTVNGDARDARTFRLRLTAEVPDAATPWGHYHQAGLTADTRLGQAGDWPQVNIRLTAKSATTPWGSLSEGLLTLKSETVPLVQWPPLTTHLETATLNHREIRTKNFRLDAQMSSATNLPAMTDVSLGSWTNLQPFSLTWQSRVEQLDAPDITTHAVACDGFWQFPRLAVNRLAVELESGSLTASAALDVATRELVFTNDAHFDPHLLARLLPPETRKSLAAITWSQPPWFRCEGRWQLPAWNQPFGGWAELEPALEVSGELACTNATVRSLPLDLLQTRFGGSNCVWRLSGLQVVSARSRLALDLTADERSGHFAASLDGIVDPAALSALFPGTNSPKFFQLCQFTQPVGLAATMAADEHDWSTFAAAGRLAATNLSVRGQWIDSVTTAFDYTNRVANFYAPRLWRAGGAQTLTADEIVLDLRQMWIWFTNGYSTAEPMALARAIGPKTARTLEPYQFLSLPVARVNGGVALHPNDDRAPDEANLTFELLRPAAFRWERLHSPAITGTVHWLGGTLVLTNLAADFYDGDGRGWAYFDFAQSHPGTDYRFDFTVTNANLHLLALDVVSPTNHLEGRLSGQLVVTSANSASVDTWWGYGHAHLRDGLIWDIPVFGILSPVLNSIAPGLGNNRATEAAAHYIITNGVIATDSLQIHSTMSRLEYKGTVNMSQQVNARVTVELLRNTPVLGVFISTMLRPVSKVFEYRVTGSLDNPKTAPVFVPEILLFPLHPFRTVEDLFTPSATNAPAH